MQIIVSDHSGYRVEYPAREYTLEQAAQEYVRTGEWYGATSITVHAWYLGEDIAEEFTISVAP